MKGETMVSDQELARGVEILLRQSQSDPQQNAAVSSVNDVVQLLGAKLGLDLSHKAAFIRDHINLLRRHQPPPLPPSPPPQFLQNHPQFLAAHFQHQQQQQLQQQLRFPPQFAIHFAGYRGHAPPQHTYAPPPQLQPQQAAPPIPPPPPKDASATGKASKESTQAGTKRRGGAGGLNKLCGVSPELQVVVGEAAMSRTEIVKHLWAYIRKNNLQDPSNKRKIICDEALRVVFETDCTDMFKMNKLLSKHILPLDPSKDSVQSKRQKVDVESTAEPTEAVSPVIISDALALFLGTTKKEMLASEATQHVLEYIKVNSLEDPSSMTVICDEKLKDLFGCESIPVVEINEMLARQHLFQNS